MFHTKQRSHDDRSGGPGPLRGRPPAVQLPAAQRASSAAAAARHTCIRTRPLGQLEVVHRGGVTIGARVKLITGIGAPMVSPMQRNAFFVFCVASVQCMAWRNSYGVGESGCSHAMLSASLCMHGPSSPHYHLSATCGC